MTRLDLRRDYADNGNPLMDVTRFLSELGYPQSPGFLPVAENLDLSSVVDYGHIFRQAASGPCSLQGVYSLREAPDTSSGAPVVPIVYVCRADTEDEADSIHRLVWNQDVAPFLLVHTPLGVKLYSGFRYDGSRQGSARGILRALQVFDDIHELIESFHAEAIDSGQLWKNFGREVKPEQRVDWKLLENLRALDKWLRTEGGLGKHVSHALIGKYVYLHYLRDRDILSARKLASWGLETAQVFGRHARLASVAKLSRQLEEWLNGEIFPIDFDSSDAPRQEHLSWIAGTFAGDTIGDSGARQLALDFKAYNFSYIPIETLSVIYEQFLHTPEPETERPKGREVGAYYTPLPVVNFMLTEMEDRLPLQKGMAVFDPACGSGAFLVQCYRRLIEKEMTREKRLLRSSELRDILQQHFFGIDRDPDACGITELSLLLTLLDYVDPPDLENTTFRLPVLRDRNIFHSDFFRDAPSWQRLLLRRKKIWVVGNPPWKKLSPGKLREEDRPAWSWMAAPSGNPIGDNQVAQAFAWRVADFLQADGYVGLLLPAMTLFEARSKDFRAAFFKRMKVDAVANFANLAEVLFGGRSRVPAAAFFYHSRKSERANSSAETVATYSPLVANQEATRPISEHKRNELWSLVVNASEVRSIPLAEIADGDGLPWKLASWGSQLDLRLLRKIERRFDTFSSLEEKGRLILSEGPQLRGRLVKKGSDRTKKCAAVVGKKKLDMNALRGAWKIFALPQRALKANEAHYIRRGEVEGLAVCRPPHVIVNAARKFAVYSDDYLIIPSRQVGIASTSGDRLFLKALSLYLSSDFAFYHQFFASAQFGVKRDVATLAALRAMPVPLTGLSHWDLEKWRNLHERLVAASPDRLPADGSTGNFAALLEELNEMTNCALGLDACERALVHDLVKIRLELNDGKLGQKAVRPPDSTEVQRYAERLKQQLDVFVGTSSQKGHEVSVVYDQLSGMVGVDFIDAAQARNISVTPASHAAGALLDKTRRRLLIPRSQWVYFNRNLRIYEGSRTFIFKPMQRFHWTESQALFDAREVIAETLLGGHPS
jgi:N-6 DNA Methylase